MSRTARILTLVLLLAAALPAYPARAQDPGTGPYIEVATLGRGMVRSVAWSPAGDVIAVGGALGIWLYGPDLTDLGLLRGHSKAVYGLAFSPDGSRLASASHDQTVRVWDVAAGEALHTFEGHTGLPLAAAWQPGGSLVASAADDGTIRLWDADRGAAVRTIETGAGWVNGVAFSPDGTQIASAQGDGSVRVWDVTSGEPVAVLAAGSDAALSVAWSADGLTVASGHRGGALRLWDMANVSLRQTLAVEGGLIGAVMWMPQGLNLALVDAPHRVGVIMPGSAVSGELAPAWLPIRADRIAWSPAGDRIAVVRWDAGVEVWDLVGGELLFAQPEHRDWIEALAWPSEGQVESYGTDGAVHVWDVDAGSLTLREGSLDRTGAAASSPDGSRLASAGPGGVTVSDVATGAVIARLPGPATTVAWSPAGDRLAVALMNGTIRIWGDE